MSNTTKPALPEPDEWACVLGVSQGIWTEPTVRAAIAAAVAEARAEIAKLKTVMIAAAEEIAAHWEAHCDAEGYGPQNLMRRLEEGIPSEYGYTAGAFAELKAKAEARAVPVVSGWIVEALKVLDTLDPEDTHEADELRKLIAAGEVLALTTLANSKTPNASLSGGRRPSA